MDWSFLISGIALGISIATICLWCEKCIKAWLAQQRKVEQDQAARFELPVRSGGNGPAATPDYPSPDLD